MPKPQPKSGHLVSRIARRERGTGVPVHTRRVTLRDGSAAEVTSLTLSDAEVPDRSYFGEACSARYGGETVSIAFAQPRLDGGLRSLLILAMTAPAAAQFAKSVEDMNKPGLLEIARIVKIAEEPLIDFPTTEPEQTASLVANIVAVAVHGRETTMDFYHANAFSHLHVRETRQMYLEPVVRVNTRTALLLSLLKRLQEVRSQFPEDAAVLEEAVE